MNPVQQPGQRSLANGTSRIRKPRSRSTIGINPLDLSPLPATPEARPITPPAAAVQGEPGRRPDPPAAHTAVESDPNDGGQRVLAPWAAGIQSVLKAMFDAHSAILRAQLWTLQASANTQSQIVQDWTQAASQARADALAACRTGLLAASAPPAEE